MLALMMTAAPASSFAHEYNRDDEGHPLRYVAYVFHPLGIALEKFVFKPFHKHVLHQNAEFVDTPVYEWVGHVPTDQVVAAAPVEIVYQEVPVEVIREVIVEVPAERERYELDTDTLFAPGKDILTAEGKAKLDAAVADIREKHAGNRINIEGHTDTDPIKESNWKSNWELGAARALAVLHYLEDHHGVEGRLLSATTFSYHQPVAGNDTSEGKAQNRRASIVIYAGD
jgi:flagellar motor protein MotB